MKDKILIKILERLAALEGKVDRISLLIVPSTGFGPLQTPPASHLSFSTDADKLIAISTLMQYRPSIQPSPNSGVPPLIPTNQPLLTCLCSPPDADWPAI
jgi:hypothetical protein